MEYAIKLIVAVVSLISGWAVFRFVFENTMRDIHTLSGMSGDSRREEAETEARKFWKSVKKEKDNGTLQQSKRD